MAARETYEEFVDKFKAKKTTDDCYTPPEVYEKVKQWAVDKYKLEERPIVRPFYPGGDYEHYDYPENCVVIDNQPFSISSKIIDFYLERGIDFFIFAPALTAFSALKKEKNAERLTVIATNVDIVYENGAIVSTDFWTNLDPGLMVTTAPDLSEAIKEANKRPSKVKSKIVWPRQIINSTMLQTISDRSFMIKRGEAVGVGSIGNPGEKRGIYGGGLLMCDKAADRYHETRRRAEQERRAEQARLGEVELKMLAQLNETARAADAS